MSIATSMKPTARTKPRLLVVIGETTYGLKCHVFEPTLATEQKHVLYDPAGHAFAVFEADFDFDEARYRLASGLPIVSRYHCEACKAGNCPHIRGLKQLGLL